MSILDAPSGPPIRGTGILRAPINASASGANIIVAATAGKQIVVLSYLLLVDGPATVKWQSKPAGSAVDLSGAMPLASNSGISNGGVGELAGVLETVSGSALHINLSAAVNCTGHLTYILV